MATLFTQIAKRYPKSTPIPLLVLAGLLLMLIVNACRPAISISKSTPTLAQEISMYGWEGYVPQSVFDAFRDEYGVTVRYVAYGDAAEATAALRRGEIYDVVVLDNVEIQIAAQEKLLAELDHRNLPNFDHVANDFRDLAFDPKNKYSIPFEWGSSGLLYRSDRVERPVTHWADLWNPTYTGKIGLWPYGRDIIGITLKSLGYSYNSENPEELQHAAERLMEIRDKVIWLDPMQASGISALLHDEAQIIFGWGYDISAAQEADVAQSVADAVTFVVPEEGTIIWMDNLAIPVSSQNHYTAELFLNFVLRPEIAAKITNENYIAVPNESAHPFIDPEILGNPLIFPTPDDLVDAEFYAPISSEAEKIHNEIWSRFITETP